jgi:hypothetical protein
MNATAETDAGRQEEIGKIILMVTSSLAALLVIAGLIYAAGTGGRSQAAIAAAGCYPGTGSETSPCLTEPMLHSEYMGITTPATQQMTLDEDAYTASEGDNLAAARTALTSEVTSIDAFDTGLSGMEFPADMTSIANAVVSASRARVTLLTEQAQSVSLTQLRSYNHRVQQANAAVETELSLLLKAVDAPVQAS